MDGCSDGGDPSRDNSFPGEVDIVPSLGAVGLGPAAADETTPASEENLNG